MSNYSLREMREYLSVYTKKSTFVALMILTFDLLIYGVGIYGVIVFDSMVIKLLCSILIGLKMSSLFVIAHDAAHDSYVNSSWLNRIIGRISFLPCYHNYSLWLIVHNRFHHQFTNMKGLNSWSPLSKKEYDDLSFFRKLLERLYRSPFGISANYLVERWWKNKFFPFKKLVGNFQGKYWFDFSLVMIYLTGQVCIFSYAGAISINSNVLEMIVLGIVLPMFVFSFMVGFSVYQQHTHESVPWFNDDKERKNYGNIVELTLHVKHPHWYNIFSHNVMEHTAHHIDPRIPCYNLAKAQLRIEELLEGDMKTMSFSFRKILITMKKCKLYDYENHCWLDFNGHKTAVSFDFVPELNLYEAA